MKTARKTFAVRLPLATIREIKRRAKSGKLDQWQVVEQALRPGYVSVPQVSISVSSPPLVGHWDGSVLEPRIPQPIPQKAPPEFDQK